MKGICPNCEKENDLELVHATEEIKIKGELIEVNVAFYKCQKCGEEFEDPRSDDDPLERAYKKYRKKHELIQPEEIRSFRKKHDLTQSELSRLLGWGAVTLSRYENGALQDDTHEKALRLAMEPRNLITLIEKSPEALSEDKKKHLLMRLSVEEQESHPFTKIYEERFGRYDADEFSGYKDMDLAKLFNAILFFCRDGVLKTVLNKLLFYSEFKHFKEYTVSITGSRYAKIPFGPAPDKWQYYFTLLIEEGALISEEIFYNQDITGEKLTSHKKPDLSLYSESELITLAQIKKFFNGWPARKISDFSHEEKGYKETLNGKFISYLYASYLQL